MTEENAEKRIIVDSDWKTEAAEEKAKLDEHTAADTTGKKLPDASFLELVNMIAMQAALGMGGYQTPDGQNAPPDLGMAKHFIDLLNVLSEKTEGHLTEDEKSVLSGTLYELRMRYVEFAANPPTVQPPAQKPA